MAEHPNAVLMRRAYDAFSAGDLDTLGTLMGEDVVWHEPGGSGLAGDYIGRDRVLEFFGKMFEGSGGTFKAEVIAILADDERAVAIQRSTATRDGKTLDTRDVLVSEVRGGKLVETQVYPCDQQQEDSFWS